MEDNRHLDLVIVLPVYNEAGALPTVLAEWVEALSKLSIVYALLFIDDGSTDGSAKILDEFVSQHPTSAIVHRHANRGHSASCLVGYRLALEKGPDYILQIDSDGQCDPSYLDQFWKMRDASPIFGVRTVRSETLLRRLVSCFVPVVGFLGTGIWVRDPNVPYRLISRSQLEAGLATLGERTYLPNIQLSIIWQHVLGIDWIPIVFRNRISGVSSVRTKDLLLHAYHLFRELRTLSFGSIPKDHKRNSSLKG